MWQCGLGGGIGIDLGVSDVIDDDDEVIDNAGWRRRFLRLDFLVGADDAEDVEAADSDFSDDKDAKDAELRDGNSGTDLDGVSGILPCGV